MKCISFYISDDDLNVVYLSNRTNYNALAEIGCKSRDENGDQSFLRTTLYSNFIHDKNKEHGSGNGMIINNHIMLSCTENGWTFFKEDNILSTTSNYNQFENEDVTPTLVCVTNTCGPPNVVRFL